MFIRDELPRAGDLSGAWRCQGDWHVYDRMLWLCAQGWSLRDLGEIYATYYWGA